MTHLNEIHFVACEIKVPSGGAFDSLKGSYSFAGTHARNMNGITDQFQLLPFNPTTNHIFYFLGKSEYFLKSSLSSMGCTLAPLFRLFFHSDFFFLL